MKKTNFYGFNDVTFLRKNKKKETQGPYQPVRAVGLSANSRLS